MMHHPTTSYIYNNHSKSRPHLAYMMMVAASFRILFASPAVAGIDISGHRGGRFGGGVFSGSVGRHLSYKPDCTGLCLQAEGTTLSQKKTAVVGTVREFVGQWTAGGIRRSSKAQYQVDFSNSDWGLDKLRLSYSSAASVPLTDEAKIQIDILDGASWVRMMDFSLAGRDTVDWETYAQVEEMVFTDTAQSVVSRGGIQTIRVTVRLQLVRIDWIEFSPIATPERCFGAGSFDYTLPYTGVEVSTAGTGITTDYTIRMKFEVTAATPTDSLVRLFKFARDTDIPEWDCYEWDCYEQDYGAYINVISDCERELGFWGGTTSNQVSYDQCDVGAAEVVIVKDSSTSTFKVYLNGALVVTEKKDTDEYYSIRNERLWFFFDEPNEWYPDERGIGIGSYDYIEIFDAPYTPEQLPPVPCAANGQLCIKSGAFDYTNPYTGVEVSTAGTGITTDYTIRMKFEVTAATPTDSLVRLFKFARDTDIPEWDCYEQDYGAYINVISDCERELGFWGGTTSNQVSHDQCDVGAAEVVIVKDSSTSTFKVYLNGALVVTEKKDTDEYYSIRNERLWFFFDEPNEWYPDERGIGIGSYDYIEIFDAPYTPEQLPPGTCDQLSQM